MKFWACEKVSTVLVGMTSAASSAMTGSSLSVLLSVLSRMIRSSLKPAAA